MKTNISYVIKKIADTLRKIEPEVLTKEDVKRLNEDAVKILKKVKTNTEKKNTDPLKGLSQDDKILLLAFVVYKRQNVATEATDNPNVEDAAKILHNKVYTSGENSQELVEKDLLKQLNKAGLKVTTK